MDYSNYRMDYSNYLLWIEICTVAMVIGTGLWGFVWAGWSGKTKQRSNLGGRADDMRRDGQRLTTE